LTTFSGLFWFFLALWISSSYGIAGHPFGTIKRSRSREGFDHIFTKLGKKRASADVGFIFIAYNLRRTLILIGKKGFREVYWLLTFCLSVLAQAYRAILMALYRRNPVNPNFCPNPNPKFKKLILVHNWQ